MSRLHRNAIWITLILTLILVGCAPAAEEPLPTPMPTVQPTAPAEPTATPEPTPLPPPTPTPSPTPDPLFPMRTTHFSYGINAHLFYPEVVWRSQDDVMEYVKDLGVEWERQQIYWSDLEPAKGEYIWDEMDEVVDAVGRSYRKLLVSIVRSPSWATADGGYGMPANPDDLGNFLYAMATRYAGRIHAYEIWNEQNYAVENDGYVQGPGRYVELLKVAYVRIKEADPYAFVLLGPLTPTGVNDPAIAIDDIAYLRQMYEYNGGEVRGYFDVLAAHVAGVHNPPDTLWPDNPGPGPGWVDHPTFYFRHVENIRRVMEEYGDGDKQIWITEFGWASLENIGDTPAPGYEYALNNTEYEQAVYLIQALEMGRSRYQPWLGAMFIWNLNFSTITPPTDEKAPFSLLRADWSLRPAYKAVREDIREHTQWP